MARTGVIVEILVPSNYMVGDIQINQFAATQLQEHSFIVDYLKAPRVQKNSNAKKDSVVLVFGTVDEEKLDEIRNHSRVLDAFGESTNPDIYTQLIHKEK